MSKVKTPETLIGNYSEKRINYIQKHTKMKPTLKSILF